LESLPGLLLRKIGGLMDGIARIDVMGIQEFTFILDLFKGRVLLRTDFKGQRKLMKPAKF